VQPFAAGAERLVQRLAWSATKPSRDIEMSSVSLGMIRMMAIESLDVLYLLHRVSSL
jgi:hypothetical protein